MKGSLQSDLEEHLDLFNRLSDATTARIQEAHIFIGHTLCGLVEQALNLT